MYERFTDRARKAVQVAHTNAVNAGLPAVDSDCLLVGLLMDDGASIAMLALKAAGIQSHALLAQIRESWGKLFESIPCSRLPLDGDVKKIIEASMMAARDLGHSYVGTEHLAIGVLKVEQCAAAKRLLSAGLTLDKLVAAINTGMPSFDGQRGPGDLARIAKSEYAGLITQDCDGKWVLRAPGAGYLYVEDLAELVAELTAKNAQQELHA